MTIPRCHHIRVNGTQCGSPALRAKRFCYFHARHQGKPTRDSLFDFPALEDANAIQIALMQVIRAIADNKIESKRAGLLLYALQTASYNLKRTSLEPGISDVVRDTSALAEEIVPAPDSVELIRAMRRAYWKLHDQQTIKEDQEIVARECGSAARSRASVTGDPANLSEEERQRMLKVAAAATRPNRSPDHPITRSPDAIGTGI